MKCRHCYAALDDTFLDLGFAPPSNAYLSAEKLKIPECYYPLKLKVCSCCWLVQTEDYTCADELFTSEYAYFSSTSSSWLAHAAQYSKMIVQRLSLTQQSTVIEVAANDGYLLKNFVEAGIPCLGIEPTESTARAAEALGIPVLKEFFSEKLGLTLTAERKDADLIIGNNVYAHVPDINDFTAGLRAALKRDGVITLEFPHLLQLIEQKQFDTVYHEHFSYLSLRTVRKIFERHGLKIWDVEHLTTHGGSLRIYGCREESPRVITPAVAETLAGEEAHGLNVLSTYRQFQTHADRIKNDLVAFLIDEKKRGKIVAAYGAAAKGNTVLNYGGVKPDLLPFVCDAAGSKQGKFMPGSHIPILHPRELRTRKLDYLLILPWNIAEEVMEQNAFLREQGTRFVTAIPEIRIHP